RALRRLARKIAHAVKKYG
nr:Chain A, G2,7,13A SMAP-18 analogue [Ovis aries]